MAKLKVLNTLREYKELLNRTSNGGLPMSLRLFAFFLLFLVAVMSGVLIILLISGVFQTGINESHTLLKNELTHISQDVYLDYGKISVHSVALGQKLSESLEKQFKKHGFAADELQDHPELLTDFLDQEMVTLTNDLEKTKSSAAFLILDATVNPAIDGAESLRAGLYIKNMEPNIVNSSFSNLRFLRGPMVVAKNHGIQILPQWKMEFQVQNMESFSKTMDTAKNSELPLSRLYYWSPSMKLASNNETVMLCSVPLRDSGGNVFGVCGFEVSSMLFKLSYSPDNSVYNRIFCILSPLRGDRLDTDSSLFAGNYTVYPSNMSDEPLSIKQKDHTFFTYAQRDSNVYTGLHKTIAFYPKDSPFKNEAWTLALMIPRQELSDKINRGNTKLLSLLALLMVASIAASSVISRKYIRPVIEALNLIKTPALSSVPKTRIPEIDDLIEFLTVQDDAPVTEKGTAKTPEFSLFQQFVKNIDTLSTAERAVFDLYLEGHTAKEIADILCLSINTIKTHNKRIYMKLNVSSRKELMVYIKMMEETGTKG